MVRQPARLLLVALLALSACGVDRANDHLESMNQNTGRMASELERDHAYLQALTKALEEMKASLESVSKSAENIEPITLYLGQLAKACLELQAMASDVFQAFLDSMEAKDPAPTPGLEEFLAGATPTPTSTALPETHTP